MLRRIHLKHLIDINNEKKIDKKFTKVVCLPEGKLFNSLKEAAVYAGVSSTTGISLACKYPFRIAGQHPISKEPLRWMYYSDYIAKGDLSKNTKIICLNTEEIFDSISDAAKKYKVQDYKIGRSCLKARKYCGQHPETRERLMWMFYEEYKILNQKELDELNKKVLKHSTIQRKGIDSYKYKVICLTTGEKFKKMSDAAKKYGIDDRRIYDACNGVLYSAGVNPKTNEKLTWVYYKDYKAGKLTPTKALGKKSIICLTTGEIYRKINDASKEKNIPLNHIRKAILGTRAFAGIDRDSRVPLVWMFYSEYEKDIDKKIQTEKIEKAISPKMKLKVIREMRKYNLCK